VVGAGGVHTVLVGDDLPELGANLVTALATLNVNDFSHLKRENQEIFLKRDMSVLVNES
jgi:hypothetical protein